MEGVADRPTGAMRVVRSVLANPDLRRVEAAYAGFVAAEFGVWVAILVYAYEQAGNRGVVAVILAQLVPATLFAPIAGALADRYRPLRVLTAGYVAQGTAMGATAIALALDAPLVVVFAAAGVAATVVTVTRPAQAVILPTLARRPIELTAVNVVSTWIESAAVFVAPVLAGVLLATFGPAIVFTVFSLVAFVSAILVAPISAGPVRATAAPARDRTRVGAASVLGDAWVDVLAGVRTLRMHRPARLVVTLIGAQLFVFGALDVIAVVLAVDVLDLGSGGAGYLTGAFGFGGIFGAMAAVALVGRRRLAPPLAIALLVWGAAFIALGIDPTMGAAFVLLAVAGAARSVLEVAGRTLLQRTSPPEVLARVFGLVEAVEMGALALGSLAVPALVALGGVDTALIVIGAFLPVLLALRIQALLRVDAAATVPVVEVALLRSLAIFAALPPGSLDGLARNATALHLAAGTTVIRQGAIGHSYYAIADGEVRVEIDGRFVRSMTRGEGFGEIALLRSVRRTATVIAASAVVLLEIDKESFVVELTGHPPSAATADSIIRDLD